MRVTVIGAGLAGVEAAHQLSKRGIKVNLCEMKPQKRSLAHKTDLFAELVCSNSLKAERLNSAAGLLKAEMRLFDSVTVAAAYETQVPAGGALAVDRDKFSSLITKRILQDENITVITGEVTKIPSGVVIIAAGPLMSQDLSRAVGKKIGENFLSFYDAAAPIVTKDSIDFNSAFAASRYERGGEDDYINCPLNKAEYEAFIKELISAEGAPLHDIDGTPDVYEGCMPVEIMAKRGENTLRFGPMKPVGLVDPNTGHRPWAVVQLRKENKEGTLFNLVGFQTNLKFGEQKRVFSMIPALKDAEFVRYGVMHRNSFINAPEVLNANWSLKTDENVFFAGQITGVEGYMESAASGILAGINAANMVLGEQPFIPSNLTMMGALNAHITDKTSKNYQPQGAAFGLLPPLDEIIKDKKERYEKLALRAMREMEKNI
ncbi:MAG: methylenetetrahydrofolate--tRNA-(uracil(54)-C(5))-methyltransferase (FADH(2)-oxidizing) TrmFO [Clostridia bacterium]|nr:methylenetetrahydrofolate--tRNA-(uracil(54)-C(5))-methyltransferase (FADH(2)-oxidizing) TrmFO [Clostridia bacterium]